MLRTPHPSRCPGGATNWGVPVVALTAGHVDLEACGTTLSARRPTLNPAYEYEYSSLEYSMHVEGLVMVNLEQPLSTTPECNPHQARMPCSSNIGYGFSGGRGWGQVKGESLGL